MNTWSRLMPSASSAMPGGRSLILVSRSGLPNSLTNLKRDGLLRRASSTLSMSLTVIMNTTPSWVVYTPSRPFRMMSKVNFMLLLSPPSMHLLPSK